MESKISEVETNESLLEKINITSVKLTDKENIISDKTKENELLDIVFALESEKQTIIDESKTKICQLKKDLIESVSENEKLKRKVTQLEQTLKQSVSCSGSSSKSEQEDVLLRAKTLLFEKTKVCKQQERHIEVLKAQVDSIKEVLEVTKEMLNLRSAEIEHLNARYESATLRTKAEKDKCDLLEKKLTISKNVYNKLKNEHDVQCKIFKELKEAYEAKIKVLTTAKKIREE